VPVRRLPRHVVAETVDEAFTRAHAGAPFVFGVAFVSLVQLFFTTMSMAHHAPSECVQTPMPGRGLHTPTCTRPLLL